MKDKQFQKLIEHAYPAQKQAMYEDLKKELNLPDDDIAAPAAKPAGKWRVFLKQPARLAACVSAAVAVACLAIILPFTLNRSGSQTATTTPVPPSTSDDSEERFVEAAACKEIKLDCSLEEYSARNDLSLFYIDRYDIADIITALYVDEKDQTDIVYFEEILIHKGTGSITELYITDTRTNVDKIQAYKKGCYHLYRAYIVKSAYVNVLWGTDTFTNGERTHTYYKAYFNYGNYQYVIALRYPVDENEIFDLIDSMVPPVK